MKPVFKVGKDELKSEDLLNATMEYPIEVLQKRPAHPWVKQQSKNKLPSKLYSGSWYVVNRSFLLMRFFVFSCYPAYIMLVFIWWVLGAVLNPEKMLPYAVMIGTFVSFVYAKVNDMSYACNFCADASIFRMCGQSTCFYT
jgi:hypothetical protein